MSRLRFRDKHSPSRLEQRFEILWKEADGPPLEREFRFDPVRRWRADFAHLPSRTLVEIEGGIWVSGRHNRAAGFVADMEKYLEAALAGWSIIRLADVHLKPGLIARLRNYVLEQERRVGKALESA